MLKCTEEQGATVLRSSQMHTVPLVITVVTVQFSNFRRLEMCRKLNPESGYLCLMTSTFHIED